MNPGTNEDGSGEQHDSSAFGEFLKQEAEQLGGGGDYPPWWEPHKGDPEELRGVVRGEHEGEYGAVYAIASVGGEIPRGEGRSTLSHTALVGKLGDAGVERGDVVQAAYQGMKKPQSGGSPYHNYGVAVIREDQWRGTDHEDGIAELLGESTDPSVDEREI
jgi:hypothetical protein